ncbi:hypothetical protein MYX76_04815 [Desulfobacterota bacterium AH_259_B03_O07]|nr:hypothetical protein [Desulfobacterota bacterium AH_259_B03_O07]
MKSATDLLITRTYTEIWERGEEYAKSGRVRIASSNEREVEAFVKGTELYKVKLKFSGAGISKNCNCPYSHGASAKHSPCKHMIAVAILWDESKGIEPPSKDEIEFETIPPPLVTRSQYVALFKSPLKADLELLRIAAEEIGSWSRPHSRLPNMPKFSSNENEPLSIKEIRKSFREIASWTNRRRYDYYFCAGEMVAAFCEVMRLVKKRLRVSSPLETAEIIREAQKFHYELVMGLIDDSDGLHEFTEAHLEDVYNHLKKMPVEDVEKDALARKLKEFENHRNDY